MNKIRATILAPRILRWLLYFWKNCGPLAVFSKWILLLRFQLYDIHQSASSNNVLVDYKAVIRVTIILDYHNNLSSFMNYSWNQSQKGKGESMYIQVKVCIFRHIPITLSWGKFKKKIRVVNYKTNFNPNLFVSGYINKIQQDATICRYLFTAKSLYIFRVSIAPIVRST